MASRKRVGEILHHDYRTLGRFLKDAVENPIKPVKVDKADAPAQEVVHLATDADFDIPTFCLHLQILLKMLVHTSQWV